MLGMDVYVRLKGQLFYGLKKKTTENTQTALRIVHTVLFCSRYEEMPVLNRAVALSPDVSDGP